MTQSILKRLKQNIEKGALLSALSSGAPTALPSQSSDAYLSMQSKQTGKTMVVQSSNIGAPTQKLSTIREQNSNFKLVKSFAAPVSESLSIRGLNQNARTSSVAQEDVP